MSDSYNMIRYNDNINSLLRKLNLPEQNGNKLINQKMRFKYAHEQHSRIRPQINTHIIWRGEDVTFKTSFLTTVDIGRENEISKALHRRCYVVFILIIRIRVESDSNNMINDNILQSSTVIYNDNINLLLWKLNLPQLNANKLVNKWEIWFMSEIVE